MNTPLSDRTLVACAVSAVIAAALMAVPVANAQSGHGTTHVMQDGTVMQGATHGAMHEGHGAAQGIGHAGGTPSRAVAVTMSDNYFAPERIPLAHGETVRFVVTNTGSLLHEFNIGTAAMHAAHGPHMQMMMEMQALLPDRLNHAVMAASKGTAHDMSHDDPNSVFVEPGQTREIVWTFDTMKDLEFACNIPGHYDAGMYGDFAIAH